MLRLATWLTSAANKHPVKVPGTLCSRMIGRKHSVWGREDGHHKNYKLVFPKQWHDTNPKGPFIKIFAVRLMSCRGKWGEGLVEGAIAQYVTEA